jgi:hypothetical protein
MDSLRRGDRGTDALVTAQVAGVVSSILVFGDLSLCFGLRILPRNSSASQCRYLQALADRNRPKPAVVDPHRHQKSPAGSFKSILPKKNRQATTTGRVPGTRVATEEASDERKRCSCNRDSRSKRGFAMKSQARRASPSTLILISKAETCPSDVLAPDRVPTALPKTSVASDSAKNQRQVRSDDASTYINAVQELERAWHGRSR